MAITKRKILVTGSAGRLGRAAVSALCQRGHWVRGFDVLPDSQPDEHMVASVTDADALLRAAEGIDVMIHLAATPDDDDFLTKLVPNNLIGTHHALEAARQQKVKRIVLASSGQVVWWQRFSGPLPIGTDVQPTPRSWYAATKMFAEAAGRAFAEAHGLSVIAVRLGWCPRDASHVQELARTEWGPDVYLSPGDAGRFFVSATETETPIKFAVVYACSKPLRTMVYDLEPTRKLLGYVPQDQWPTGVE